MPLVRIDLPDDIPNEQRRAIADGVNAGLVRGLGMDEDRPDDVFVAVTENGPEDWYPGRSGSGTAA